MKKKCAFLISHFAILLLLATMTAQAASYYVATTGNDSNSGAIGSPFLTGQKCAAVAQPGDTCFVRGGTYKVGNSSSFVQSVRSGTLSAPITFKAYTAETPVISMTVDQNVPDTYGFFIYQHSYIIMDGFTITGGDTGILSYSGGQNNQMLNNTVSFQWSGGISSYGGSTNAIMRGNTVHDTNRQNWPRGQAILNGKFWGTGITAGSGSTNNLIENNVVYWNSGEGISCHDSSDNCIIRSNLVADNWAVNIYVDGSRNAIVEKNLSYLSTDARNWAGCVASCNNNNLPLGISTATENTNSTNADGLRVLNNIIVGTLSGILAWQGAVSVRVNNHVYANNTLVANDAGIELANPAGVNDVTVVNNIVTNHTNTNGYIVRSAPAPTNSSFHHNIYNGSVQRFNWGGSILTSYSAWAAQAGESGSSFTNPLLVNASAILPRLWNDGVLPPAGPIPTRSALAASYKLQSGSPAINAGATITQTTPDFDDLSRPQGAGYDIGAFEFGTPPSLPAPTNVQVVAQ